MVDVTEVAQSNRNWKLGPAKGPIVVIPFFRNEHLVGPLFDSLLSCAEELHSIGATVLAINDSPDYSPLSEALRAAVNACAGTLEAEVLVNATNQGFVRSVNQGLTVAMAERRDALLLNSDTRVFQGAFSEMVRVASLDPMIGFVNPRSNNATIASLPVQEAFRHESPDQSYLAFRRLARQMPEYHYVPTAVGFCMLVRNVVLVEFGLLDEAYGAGYNEENDLVMRANRCGYRAVLANHAFVYHDGEASFTTQRRQALEAHNAKLLADRYPEYSRGIAQYFNGPTYLADCRLTALLPDSNGRHDVLFDFSDMGSYHNGTIEAAKALLYEFVRTNTGRYNLFVSMHADHARFHGLDGLSGVQVVPVDTDRRFAIGFRVGQPMTIESFLRLDRLAVRTVWFMLDTITWDCLGLCNPDVEPTWSMVFEHADAVIYNSDYTRDQFARRFPSRAGVIHLVSPHSLSPKEYLPSHRPAGCEEFILVAGNAFPHKFVGPTVEALVKAVPDRHIVCIGLEHHDHSMVTCYRSGCLSDDMIESLYARCSFVVFPSHYEGFGFPLLKGMAHEKPVLMRDGPLAREMKHRLGENSNILLYGDTSQLVQIVRDAPPTWQSGQPFPEREGWSRTAREITGVIDSLLAASGAHVGLVRRLRGCAAMQPTGERGDLPEAAVAASLSPFLQAVRSLVIRAPWLRRAIRPFWRWLWKMSH
jgi:GT2 family glycosyltransferase